MFVFSFPLENAHVDDMRNVFSFYSEKHNFNDYILLRNTIHIKSHGLFFNLEVIDIDSSIQTQCLTFTLNNLFCNPSIANSLLLILLNLNSICNNHLTLRLKVHGINFKDLFRD